MEEALVSSLPRSLGSSQRSIAVRRDGSWRRRLLGFVGPGYLIAIGYMDPGNWATDLAGGSAYGYSLLWIVGLSSVMAMFLQVLAARLGIASGMDLAQACRRHSSSRTLVWQWLLCELAICACDVAEVVGTAIALQLLFGIPLAWGVGLTVLDVFLLLWLQQRGWRTLEAAVIAMLAVVLVCLAIDVVLATPRWHEVLGGFMPKAQTVTDPRMLFIAIGILGATVMPHNLYLHSSIVQTRRFELSPRGRREAVNFATLDVVTALAIAFVINAAILVTSAATFHARGHHDVAELQDAYLLLEPLTGTAIAATLFGVALLASGLSSSVTATLAGQVVMEGFLRLRMQPWLRRLVTRSIAIVPALGATLLYGETGIARLLLFSQVVLSLQLPFAIVPLIRYTSSRRIMGELANRRATVAFALLVVALIVGLNAVLVWRAIAG
jgi:manganese transport protein